MTDNGPGSLTTPAEGAAYGRNYLEWKGWDAKNFARVTGLDKCYFDAELKRAGFQPESHVTALEIGFGNGSFLAYAKSKGWDVIGTEVNPFLVDMANGHGLKAVRAADLGNLKQGSFDLVAAFDVLEHIPQDYLLEFVGNLVSMLKPGGLLLARFPNADSPFGLVNQNGDMTHLSAIGLGKVRYLARELRVELVLYGGQAVPVVCGGVVRSLRRMAGSILFKSVDMFVNRVFFPNDRIAFCSSNAIMVLRATVPAPAA